VAYCTRGASSEIGALEAGDQRDTDFNRWGGGAVRSRNEIQTSRKRDEFAAALTDERTPTSSYATARLGYGANQ
jgi:hypothetical protein